MFDWMRKDDVSLQVAYWAGNCRKIDLWAVLDIWYPIVVVDGEDLSDYYPHLANHLEVNIVGDGYHRYLDGMSVAPHYLEVKRF